MIVIYCSKPQQTDADTPTPLAHCSHTCMRALALGHGNVFSDADLAHSASMKSVSGMVVRMFGNCVF